MKLTKKIIFTAIFLNSFINPSIAQEDITLPSEQTYSELQDMYRQGMDASGQEGTPSLRTKPPVGPPIAGSPVGDLPVAALLLTAASYMMVKKRRIKE
ncbi:MAG: hypothetical protein ACLVKO_03815 [Dysgonomonas sp.]